MALICASKKARSTAFSAQMEPASPPRSKCSPACSRLPREPCGYWEKDIADPAHALAIKQRCGVVPENLSLFENLTAREYLIFIGRMYLLPLETIRKRTDELLTMMGLENEERKLAMEFSHGMRKKLALAAALLPNPDLLFLDEPFEGVDAVASRVLRDTLRKAVEQGATVFLTSHVLEIVEKLCTHVGIIAQGKLVHQGSMEELRQSDTLEQRFLEVVGADELVRPKLSWLEGGPMRKEHILAILWLRWRLTRNQFARAGKFNAVISVLMLFGLVIAAGGAVVGGFLVGLLGLSQIRPMGLLVFWDVVMFLFLIIWLSGLLVEIQRSESIDLARLLHLPVTLEQVFIFNYLASLLTPSILIFLPGMLSVCVGLMISRGPWMVLMIPLLAAFVLLLTAWTYCLRGWLAALMSNQRRKRSILVWTTIGFILVAQLPNALVHSRIFQSGTAVKGALENKERIEAGHLLIPPGWVGYGAMGLANKNPWPTLGAIAVSCLLGGYGLRRAYRTTLRVYTGVETPAKTTREVKVDKSRLLLVERRVPGLPEDTAALALATFRSLLRAPEVKMALVMPVIAGVVGASVFLTRPKSPIPPQLIPFVTGFLAVFAVFSFSNLMANMFGLDRSGFRALVLLPTRRHHILLAKNLAVLPPILCTGAVFLLILSWFMRLPWHVILTGLLQLAVAFLVFSLLCNLMSIFAPYRLSPGTLRTKKPKAIVFVAALATMVSAPLALIPVLIPPAAQLLFNTLGWVSWLPMNVLVAFLITGLAAWLYWILLPAEGRLLQKRERTILAAVTEALE
jgi:ABC-type Na+ transport system ATPase subunit NatA